VTNLDGTENVLDHCARFGKRVLVASTSEVYGDDRTPEPLREDARRVYGPTTQKRWLYADSKAMDEYLALAYRQERGLDFVIARLFNTVGPRQSGQYGMVVARFVQAAVAGGPLEIHGDGSQTRTFCHVQDTIRALTGLMDDPATSGEIFNVGSRNWISIIDLAQRIQALAHSHSELVYVPYDKVYGLGIDDMLHRVPAIEKIKGAIGWEPRYSLDEILADVIEHARRAPAPVDAPRPL
jgi:UDP-glucose 4-epimerase